MKRVTADSNIYISAYLRGGKPLDLVELARAKQIELAVSEDILSETGRVLAAKFKVEPGDVQVFRQGLRGFTKLVAPAEKLDAVPADATDNGIVECAVEAGSDDRHGRRAPPIARKLPRHQDRAGQSVPGGAGRE